MALIRPALIWLLLAVAGCGSGDSPPPVVTNDVATTNEAMPVSIDVLNNDSNVVANSLTVSSPPTHGSAMLSGSAFLYSPVSGFSGTDSFSYSVKGNNGDMLTGTVTIQVDAVPVAANDQYVVTINTPKTLDILANDNDPDGTVTGGISIVKAPAGTLALSASSVDYTPPPDFTGSDSFTYRVADNLGASSNVATVTITIVPLTATQVVVTSHTVPQSGYTFLNNTWLHGSLLSSPGQVITIPPNTISFVLMLRGTDVGGHSGRLFISELVAPDGSSPPTLRDAAFCQPGMCTVEVPKRPGISATSGDWQFRLGTTANDLGNINFSDVQLQLTVRVGPAPNLAATYPATLDVRPFFSARSITAATFRPVLDALVALGADNGLKLNIEPLTVISDPQYAEVATDFNDPTTAALVSMGDPGKVNVFFVDSFSGGSSAGTVGVAPGIPGSLGVKSRFNGVLIDATATRGGGASFYARTTAEFTLHEMAHFLGLFHTTESDFSAHDILADTPECTSADDANNNNMADVSECPDGLNLMFWTNDFYQSKDPLTPDQRFVLFDSALATP